MNRPQEPLREALERLVRAADEYGPREAHDWRCEYRTAEMGWVEGEPPVIKCECGFDDLQAAIVDAQLALKSEAALRAVPGLHQPAVRES